MCSSSTSTAACYRPPRKVVRSPAGVTSNQRPAGIMHGDIASSDGESNTLSGGCVGLYHQQHSYR